MCKIDMSNIELAENERVDDLQFKNLLIVQNREQFCFGLDAVLLARFSSPKDNDKIIDIGTGTGIIPIMVSGLCESGNIFGIDIQQCMCDMALKSIALNSLEERVTIKNGDIREVKTLFQPQSFTLVISNPPYIKAGNGVVNDLSQRAISRHEVTCKLEDVVYAASYLLRDKGRFTMVNKPERIADCIELMHKYGIEPKKIQLVYPKADKPPSAMLIEGIKGAKEGLRFMRPIIVMNESGEYTCQVNSIYSDEGEDIFK